jgi:peroxiredoxin Q/BCP
MPAVGDPAPDLTLPDADGTQHHLADQRGHWVVLYFYPEDDTTGCTTEACEFRDLTPDIQAEGAVVWGVSPQGLESKAKFRDKYSLSFPLLADEDHAVADRYGTWVLKQNYGRSYMGVQRATFLIDPEGRVARVWPKVKALGHAAEVLGALREERTAPARA